MHLTLTVHLLLSINNLSGKKTNMYMCVCLTSGSPAAGCQWSRTGVCWGLHTPNDQTVPSNPLGSEHQLWVGDPGKNESWQVKQRKVYWGSTFPFKQGYHKVDYRKVHQKHDQILCVKCEDCEEVRFHLIRSPESRWPRFFNIFYSFVNLHPNSNK